MKAKRLMKLLPAVDKVTIPFNYHGDTRLWVEVTKTSFKANLAYMIDELGDFDLVVRPGVIHSFDTLAAEPHHFIQKEVKK